MSTSNSCNAPIHQCRPRDKSWCGAKLLRNLGTLVCVHMNASVQVRTCKWSKGAVLGFGLCPFCPFCPLPSRHNDPARVAVTCA